MKNIAYSKSAIRALRKMPTPDARRITEKVEQFASDPSSLAHNVKALKGSDFICLRVGNWRVIMDDTNTVLAVLKIGPRGSVYE